MKFGQILDMVSDVAKNEEKLRRKEHQLAVEQGRAKKGRKATSAWLHMQCMRCSGQTRHLQLPIEEII